MSKLRRITFGPKASRPKNGLALVFDLEGFSAFFNQPDVSEYVTRFLNHILGAMATVIEGGDQNWIDGSKNMRALPLQPTHVKFLGDGALYIWTTKEGEDFSPAFITTLCNRLFNLKSEFKNVVARCADDVPVMALPARIRFGLARGSIFELTHVGSSQREYIGFCINLASRLQGYCRELGFVASARVMIPTARLTENGYIKVVATKIRGFPSEIVIVDSSEYEALSESRRAELFESLN